MYSSWFLTHSLQVESAIPELKQFFLHMYVRPSQVAMLNINGSKMLSRMEAGMN
jgi:hypothetical protein